MALAYAFDAVQRLHRLEQATPATITELAGRIDPFRPSHEPVQLLVTPSVARQPVMPPHRRRRMVQNFGPLKRAHQMLVADVLATTLPPRENQFLYRGGMPAALKAVEGAYRDGYSHAVEIDLVSFYGGLRLERFAHLLRPLPTSVITNVVWDTSCRRNADDDDYAGSGEPDDPSRSGLVGLSLGAATSPIVGEIIIRHLLDAADLGRVVVTYADNILVLGRDAGDARARAEHLMQMASRLDAGPLRTRDEEVRVRRFAIGNDVRIFDADEPWGVDFCKQVGKAREGGGLSWEPCEERKLEHQIAAALDSPSLDAVAKAEAQVAHWRRAYPLWAEGDAWEAVSRAELASLRYCQAAFPVHRAAAINALVLASLSNGHVPASNFAPEPEHFTERQRERRAALVNDADRMIGEIMGALRAA